MGTLVPRRIRCIGLRDARGQNVGHDLHRSNAFVKLARRCAHRRIGEVPDADAHFLRADARALPARRSPFPIVAGRTFRSRCLCLHEYSGVRGCPEARQKARIDGRRTSPSPELARSSSQARASSTGWNMPICREPMSFFDVPAEPPLLPVGRVTIGTLTAMPDEEHEAVLRTRSDRVSIGKNDERKKKKYIRWPVHVRTRTR